MLNVWKSKFYWFSVAFKKFNLIFFLSLATDKINFIKFCTVVLKSAVLPDSLALVSARPCTRSWTRLVIIRHTFKRNNFNTTSAFNKIIIRLIWICSGYQRTFGYLNNSTYFLCPSIGWNRSQADERSSEFFAEFT